MSHTPTNLIVGHLEETIRANCEARSSFVVGTGWPPASPGSDVPVVAGEAVSIPEEVGENLPLGVIVFPQMRQYTPNGNGMPIPNPRSYIETLCDAWGVPVIFTEDFSAPEGVEATMARFQIEAGQ